MYFAHILCIAVPAYFEAHLHCVLCIVQKEHFTTQGVNSHLCAYTTIYLTEEVDCALRVAHCVSRMPL